MPRLVAFAFIFFVSGFLSSDAVAENVTMCGQVVSDGVLTGDLDCSGSLGGVVIDEDGALDFAGFTLTAGTGYGVGCKGDCFIEGNGGALIGGAHASWGIRGPDEGQRMEIDQLQISDFIEAIDARTVFISGSEISGNGVGVFAIRLAAVVDSQLFDNEHAVMTKTFATALTTLSNNRYGAEARRISLLECTASNNGVFALRASKVRLRGSTVEGSGTDPSCVGDPAQCVDVASSQRPRLEDSTCGSSADLTPWDNGAATPTGENWGLCTFD